MDEPLTRLSAALEGRYTVKGRLGEGGMAAVYLAEDLKHARLVAIKVLKPELAAVVGPDRFLEEIRTTAALQHPHILPLHDSGEADGLLYYVMPYVDGESLRERLSRERQLSVEEALAITKAVAEGLEAAHDRGVVHRDVKPANILMGAGGPLIADFGIAMAHSVAGERRLTETGLSLGTPGYMSPEQVTGDHPVDRRSDIYSLGCVLYEMLVGEAPFAGSSAQAVIARLLSGETPSARARRSTVPLHVDAVIRKAIERVPADRFSSCGEMFKALGSHGFRHGAEGIPELAGIVRTWRRRVVTLGALTGALLAISLWGWFRPVPPPERPISRFALSLPKSEGYAAGRNAIAISPGGRHLAFVSQGQGGARLYVRALDEIGPWLVPGSVGALDPFFSADGQWVGYATTDGLMKVPLSGGEPERIVGFAEPRGMFWTDENQILFGSYSGLWRVEADGGRLTQVTTLREDEGDAAHTRPELLPGGQIVLFTIRGADDDVQIAALHLASGEIRPLLRGVAPGYSHTGHLLFGRDDGTLMAVPFDPDRGEVTGTPEAVVTGIVAKPGTLDYGLSRSGTLVYLGGGADDGVLVLVDRQGGERTLVEADDALNGPRFSPDGKRIALGVGAPPTRQVWVYETEQETLAPLTYEGHNYYGLWWGDGSRITFARETGSSVDVYWKPSDGSGEAEPLLRNDGFNYPELWSPDGQILVVRAQDEEGGHDLLTFRPGADAEPRPYLTQPPQEESPAISADGRWLAYASDLSGIFEVYVTSFPEPGARQQVSVGGGAEPAWSPGGAELLYWRGDTLVAATVTTSEGIRVVERADLFVADYMRWPFHRNYDVHPDGTHFVMIRLRGVDSQQLVVAQNWSTTLDTPGERR